MPPMLLRHSGPTPDSAGPAVVAALRSPAVLLGMLAGIVRRQLLPIVLIVLSVLGLGVGYLVTTPSEFTAVALLLLDSRRTAVKAEQASPAESGYDPARVESQVQLLRTDTIALSVIRDLHLTDDPEFRCGGAGFLTSLIAPVVRLFEDENPCSDFEITRTAVAVFANRLTV